jgi:hypothetical protein
MELAQNRHGGAVAACPLLHKAQHPDPLLTALKSERTLLQWTGKIWKRFHLATIPIGEQAS